eukprot:TRINITY_DN4215_c0_g1_i1.p1 TRINITY_DN4215_c0_g1~~TRINITY_DN4215_c0_g1_i1.p1  ORF type:complete len:178 (+),score=33.85 TRINITY_DN4215_c0_g1_i1:46-534(+)
MNRWVQIRWSSGGRMSMTKRVENMVLKDKAAAGSTIKAEKAMRKQLNLNNQVDGGDPQNFQVISEAWKLVPDHIKNQNIPCGSPEAEMKELLKILNKTGALEKYFKDRKAENEVKEADDVDSKIKMIAGVFVFVVLIATAASIHNYNSFDHNNKRRAVRYPT